MLFRCIDCNKCYVPQRMRNRCGSCKDWDWNNKKCKCAANQNKEK